MPTPGETLTPREKGLRQVINEQSRRKKAGEPQALIAAEFGAPQSSTERLFQATINDVLKDGPFSGASDDFVPSS